MHIGGDNMADSRDNKQTIISGALELFSKKGFDGTSTAEICERAGVTKPTMYHYFGSKEGLLDDILLIHYKSFLDNLSMAATLPEDIPLTFFRLAKVYFDNALRDEPFFRFRAGLTLRNGEDTAYISSKKYIEQEGKIITDFFYTASQHIGNIRGKETLCTISFIGTINATISAYLQTGDETLVSDDTIYRLRQQFLYGIYS